MAEKLRRERGARFRAARELAGMSQQYVAQHMKCSRSWIGLIEKGANISLEDAARLAVLYGVSLQSVAFADPVSLAKTGDAVAKQMLAAGLDPQLREKLWMLYQVFVRPGAQRESRAPRAPAD